MNARCCGVVAAVLLLLFPSVRLNAEPPQSQPASRRTSQYPNADRQALLTRTFPEIDRLFRAFAERSRVPGIAYGILIDGELVHTGAVGVRDLETRLPVDRDTVFRIASMTKSFTAVAILRLRDEGKLSLDDFVERYVPELATLTYPTTDSPRITIRHLLSHAEGFPEDNPWGDRQLAATDDEMSRMMRQGIPFSTAPGTAYEYSNYGFAILGRIVARVAGIPYAEYVTRHVLTPLGMTSTTLEPASVPRNRLARGYRLEDGGWKEEPPLPDGAFGPMGGMVTSTTDLGRYVGFLMSAWPPRDDPETGPIKRSSAREMQQVWRPSLAVVTRDTVDSPLRLNAGGYGFGLRVSQTCGVSHQVAHSGGLPGFGSQMRWLPDHGVAVIALGNLTYTSWGKVIDDAIDLMAQTGALQARVPQPSAALIEARDGVNRLIGAWDDRLADQLAANNLFLDRSKAVRQQEFNTMRSELGVCRPAGNLEPENALRGGWTLACDRGTLHVALTLAPTVPPKVQFLEIAATTPLGPALRSVVARIAGLIGAQTPPGVAIASMLAPTADVAGIGRQVEAASAWGTCAVGEIVNGGGDLSARVRLICSRGHLDLTVQRQAIDGPLTVLRLEPSADRTCGQ